MKQLTFRHRQNHIIKFIVVVLFLFSILAFGNNEKASASSDIEVTMLKDLNRELINNLGGSIAYNGEFYLLITRDGDLLKSKDGKEWNHYNSEAIYSSGIKDGFAPVVSRKIIWDGKQFICVLRYSLATSPDGNLWTFTNIPHPDASKEYQFQDLILAGDKYILVAQDYDKDKGGFVTPGPNTFFYSNDFVTFHQGIKQSMDESISGERPIDNLAWNGKSFLAGGNGSAKSSDGIHWQGTYANYNGYNYIWDGKMFWAAFQGDIFASNAQGEEITRIEVQDYEGLSDVHLATIGFNGAEYVAGGYRLGGSEEDPLVLFHSTNGKKWEKITVPGGASGIETIFPTSDGFLLLGSKVWYFENKSLNTPSSWALSDIQEAKSYQLISKDLSSLYRSNITRQQFSELCVRIYETFTGKTANSPVSNPFIDTTNPYVLKAYALGIVRGQESNRFAPNNPITRQDLAVMMYSTLKLANIDLNPSRDQWQKPYTDLDQVAKYAKPALQFFNDAGIINGKEAGKIVPRGNTTREEAIAIMMRVIEKYNPRPDALVPVEPAAPAEPELTPIEKATRFLNDNGYSIQITDRDEDYIEYEIILNQRKVFTYGVHPNGDKYNRKYNSWVQVETLPHLDSKLLKDAQEFIQLVTGTSETGLAESILRMAEEHNYVYDGNDVYLTLNGLDILYDTLDQGYYGQYTILRFNS